MPRQPEGAVAIVTLTLWLEQLYNPAAFALYACHHDAFRDQNDHDHQNDHLRWAGEDVRVKSNVT